MQYLLYIFVYFPKCIVYFKICSCIFLYVCVVLAYASTLMQYDNALDVILSVLNTKHNLHVSSPMRRQPVCCIIPWYPIWTSARFLAITNLATQDARQLFSLFDFSLDPRFCWSNGGTSFLSQLWLCPVRVLGTFAGL